MQYCEKRAWLGLLGRAMLFIAGFVLIFGAAHAEAAFAERAGSMSEIKAVRVSNSADKTRIVLDGTKETSYKVSVLSNPQRIVVDIQNAWLSPDVKKSTTIDSRFAKAVRIAQHDTSTVRVVVESSVGKNNYKVFPLKGGSTAYRIVLDFGNLGGSSGGAAIDFNPKPKEESAGSTGGSSGTATTGTAAEKDNGTDGSTDVVVKGEPVFTPGLKGKIIALDAGHGGSDVGAIGPTGVTEKGVTLRVALELQKKLIAEGASVIMTRTTDTEVSPKKAKASDIEELQARCDAGNDKNADIFVSLHMDSFTNSSPSGTTGYYYVNGSKAGRRLAKELSEALVAELGTGNRGTKSCNFYVVKHTTMPAALIEMAFISNDKEERLMNSEAGVKKAAEGLLKGIRSFFG
ncbi:N-acetylmuramoyl-L-alanine amidase [Anaerovibrio sp.]|uniref:N-acetylmuramoyl-L-alanine amidase n=1 Tax=Anaerovibrio sp. TaxID=1872532 RepID=UPI003F1430E2